MLLYIRAWDVPFAYTKIIIIIWTGAGSIAINGVYQAGPWDVGDPFPPSRRTLALYVVSVLNQGLSKVIVQR